MYLSALYYYPVTDSNDVTSPPPLGVYLSDAVLGFPRVMGKVRELMSGALSISSKMVVARSSWKS